MGWALSGNLEVDDVLGLSHPAEFRGAGGSVGVSLLPPAGRADELIVARGRTVLSTCLWHLMGC